MSSEQPLAYVPAADRLLTGADAPPAPPEQTNIVRLLHRLLRGRYWIAITLGIIGACAGGVAGYFLDVPKYKAEGLVRIQPVMPKILFESEQSELMPMFSSFVNTQANLIKNERVINKAMFSDGWRSLNRGVGPEAESAFRDGLKVTTARDTPELITVSFVDKEARAAVIGVQEAISAYQNIFGESEASRGRAAQLGFLDERKRGFDREIGDLEDQIRQKAAEFETSDLDRLHDHHFQLLLELDAKVAALQVRFAEQGIDPDMPLPALTQPDEAPEPHVDRTPEQIANVDREMAQNIADLRSAERIVARLRSDGLKDKHPDLVRALADLEFVTAKITQAALKWNAEHQEVSAVLIDPVNETPAQLVRRFKRLKEQADVWRRETETISRKKLEIDGLKRAVANLQTKLAETNQRIDAIGLESKMEKHIGRVEVFLPESLPSSPTVDPRKKYAAMGFMLGGGFPVAIVLLIGLLDRRLRYSDEAEGPTDTVPLLGILPELPGKAGDPEQTASAVHCIHHIRTLLQISGPQRKVYVVSSPTAGDGKTSLSLSLGMSFAATGRRTVLVDFDLVGQGLTGRFKAVPVHSVGNAMLQGTVNGCAIGTPVPGLDLIAAARDDVHLVTRISSDNVKRVIDQLKEAYEIVLIDTGPVLGSLEASAAAAAADGVILIVGRGQQRANVQAALSRLGKLSSRVVGMVFNRAGSADFARSSASASIRSLRAHDVSHAITLATPPQYSNLDPLARSVASDLDSHAAAPRTEQGDQ